MFHFCLVGFVVLFSVGLSLVLLLLLLLLFNFGGLGIVGFCSDSRGAWSLLLFGWVFVWFDFLESSSSLVWGRRFSFGSGSEVEGYLVWDMEDCSSFRRAEHFCGFRWRSFSIRRLHLRHSGMEGFYYSWIGPNWEGGFYNFSCLWKRDVFDVFYFQDFFFSFPYRTASRVSRMISIAVSIFKLFAGGFWVVRIILSTFFTYFLSCAQIFIVLKLLAVVGIGNMCRRSLSYTQF